MDILKLRCIDNTLHASFTSDIGWQAAETKTDREAIMLLFLKNPFPHLQPPSPIDVEINCTN